MKKHYAIGQVAQFVHVEHGQVLEFDLLTTKRGRTVKLTFNTNDQFEVWMATEHMPEAVLLAADHGLFQVEFMTEHKARVQIVGPTIEHTDEETGEVTQVPDPGASCFVKGHAPSHTVQTRDLPKFTNIEPRVRRNSDFDQMMQIVKMNNIVFEKRLAKAEGELAAAKTREAARLVEPDPDPAPAPEPEPDPAPEPDPKGGGDEG